jgi:hypothetical protein
MPVQGIKEPEYFPEDSPLYWKVRSRTDSEVEYLVYLGANGLRGACACIYHVATVQPAYNAGKPVRQTCWHVREANRRFHQWALWVFEQKNLNREHDK